MYNIVAYIVSYNIGYIFSVIIYYPILSGILLAILPGLIYEHILSVIIYEPLLPVI